MKIITIIIMLLNASVFATKKEAVEDIKGLNKAVENIKGLNKIDFTLFDLGTNKLYFAQLQPPSSLEDGVPDDQQHLGFFLESNSPSPILRDNKSLKLKDIPGSTFFSKNLYLSRDKGLTSYFFRIELVQEGPELNPPGIFHFAQLDSLIRTGVSIVQNSEGKIKHGLSFVESVIRTTSKIGDARMGASVTLRVRSNPYLVDDHPYLVNDLLGEFEFGRLYFSGEQNLRATLSKALPYVDKICAGICDDIMKVFPVYQEIYNEYLRNLSTGNEELKELATISHDLLSILTSTPPEIYDKIKLSKGIILALKQIIDIKREDGLPLEESSLEKKSEDQTEVFETESKRFIVFQEKILPALKKLEKSKGDKTWKAHIERVLNCLDTILEYPDIGSINDYVFYVNGKGIVERSKKIFEVNDKDIVERSKKIFEALELESKNNKPYTQQDLLEQLKAGYTVQKAWCTKQDGVWSFMAHLEEPKQDEVSSEKDYPKPQISPASSSSSSREHATEAPKQIVIQEDLSHLLTIENEAQKAIYTLGYRLNRVNEKQMDQMKINIVKDEIFVRKGYDQYPIYAGFIQQVLKGEEVTLGKSEGNYEYKKLAEFAKSIEKQFSQITVHYPRQCSGSQKVYLVSDKKSDIYFVCLPKKGEPYVMKQIPERSI